MYRSIEELRNIAVSMKKPFEELLYEMLIDAMKTIDKAIQYIEINKLNGNKISEMLCGSEIVALLEILKGESND